MADSIHVKLPDGSVKEVPKGTTALDIAKSIGQRLADATLVARRDPSRRQNKAPTAISLTLPGRWKKTLTFAC